MNRKHLFILLIVVLMLVVSATAVLAAITSTTAPMTQVSAPASVVAGAYQSDTEVRIFPEQQGVTLANDVSVNITTVGLFDNLADLTPGVVASGQTVSSYLVHFDSVTGSNTRTFRLMPGGTVAFEERIVGVIMLDAELHTSDFLGAPGTVYPTGIVGRGLEPVPIEPGTGEYDFISVTCDTLSVGRFGNGARIDQIRILTVDESCAALDLEKHTNGQDADTPTGPVLSVGDPVEWTYYVTNTGEADLVDVQVTDDKLGFICTIPSLPIGATETCTANGIAVAGQYANLGTATAVYNGRTLTDTDPSHYYAEEPAGGGEGCTPGYWKQKQHFDSWNVYAPNDSYSAIFGVSPSFGNKTLLDALKQGGGGEKALGRHASAALLNASSGGVSFFYTATDVINIVQQAYATGDFEGAKNLLEAQNDPTFCPLN